MNDDVQSEDLAFATLFRRHFDYVWRCARAVAGPEAADDVTQEAFIVARRRLASFSGESPRAWLFTIVRNVARNATRGQRRRERHLQAVPTPEPPRGPEEEAALRQAADRLDAFIDGLPPQQRDAFVLMELEGLSAREVAEAADVPTRTVYSRLRAAREAFARFTASPDVTRGGTR